MKQKVIKKLLTYFVDIQHFVFLSCTKPKYSKYPFVIYFASPLLFVGGIGSTLYHAFRSSDMFMWLDVAPIFVLTLSIGAWFYWLAYRNKIIAIIFLGSFIFLRYSGFAFFELQTAINISYFLTGVYIFIPAYLLLKKVDYNGFLLLCLSAFLFALSLFFRWYDDFDRQLFSAGTHWLWHVFSASGAFVLGKFLVDTQDIIGIQKDTESN